MTPEPPFLVIRKGKSFWVESDSTTNCAATLQAFREGCFFEASCYDATGGMWPIVDASLKRPPSILQRLMVWRRVPIELRFGIRTEVGVKEIVSELAAVLVRESEFTESLGVSSKAALERVELIRTHNDIIQVAREIA